MKRGHRAPRPASHPTDIPHRRQCFGDGRDWAIIHHFRQTDGQITGGLVFDIDLYNNSLLSNYLKVKNSFSYD
jgi:hypothetical protein